MSSHWQWPDQSHYSTADSFARARLARDRHTSADHDSSTPKKKPRPKRPAVVKEDER